MKEDRIIIKNISNIKDCYGCGVCAAACSKKIIDIRLNVNGFYEPYVIDDNNCTNCGLCREVCAFLDEDLAVQLVPLNSWAAWSNDESTRYKCSSGGVGFEIGKQSILKGLNAISCRYNPEKQIAEHYVANSVNDYFQSIGSKYIQSYTVEAFRNIDKRSKYLITGTPCQIDSFRRFIRRFKCQENFILMDFFCHGVPSMNSWKAYLKMQEQKLGQITNASWRNKDRFGWHDSWQMRMQGENGQIDSRWSQGDMFYKMFLGDVCLAPQCQKNCKYKYDKSSADLRIGDLWGQTYAKDEKGVSALVAFTEKGEEIIKGLEGVKLIEHPFEIVAEGQMKENAQAGLMYPVVMQMLKNKVPFDSGLYQVILFTQKVLSKVKRILGIR